MVKNDDKAPLPASARRIAQAIRGLMAEKGFTQMQVAEAIGTDGPRAQSYVSTRVNGRDAFDARELDLIALMLGFADAFDLIAEAQRRTQS